MFMVCAFCSCMCFVSDYVFILVSLLMSDQQDLKIDQLPFVAESLSQLDLQVAAGSVEISKKKWAVENRDCDMAYDYYPYHDSVLLLLLLSLLLLLLLYYYNYCYYYHDYYLLSLVL